MTINKSAGLILAGLLLLAAGGTSLAGQTGGPAQVRQTKELKRVPIRYTHPASGAQMFKEYCAACHGMEGRGDGPAVEFLKAPPQDLRTLAQRNRGKYPALRVKGILLFGNETESKAHGTIDMPLWGSLFRTLDPNHGIGRLRVNNLNEYIESLQQQN